MPPEVTPQGVGIIGPERSARYACERIALRRDYIAVVTCFDNDDGFADVIQHPEASLIYCAGPVSESLIQQAIQANKHVVLDSPMWLTSSALRRIGDAAIDRNVVATTHQPRYWLDDFQWARTAVQQKKLAKLQRVRLTIHEQGLPGDFLPQGVLRDLGYHLFDQLLVLAESQPRGAKFWPSVDPHKSGLTGFLTVIDFENGTSTAIELQCGTFLSWRTGWLLDGSAGAYRGGRIYTQTDDGEIVDEPMNKFDTSADPFLDALSAAIQNPGMTSPLTDLFHAAQVMDLIERLEHSVSSV